MSVLEKGGSEVNKFEQVSSDGQQLSLARGWGQVRGGCYVLSAHVWGGLGGGGRPVQ